MSFLDFFKNLFGKKDKGPDQPQEGMDQPSPQQTPQTGPAQTSTPPPTSQS